MKRRPTTPAEIEAGKTPAGGFTGEQLRAWGVRSPPASGWRRRLLRIGVPESCPYPEGFEGRPTEVLPPTNPLLAFGPPTEPIAMPSAALEIFADGSCDPFSGRGGWGFVAVGEAGIVHEASGGNMAATNNRMEMQAVIEALHWLAPATPAILWTDSAYVFRECRASRHGWKRAGWMQSPASARANAGLLQTLEELLTARTVEVRWVRGHAGTAGNERADKLAAIGRLRR